MAQRETPEIEVWKANDHSPYPWRFAIRFKGHRHIFAGIPNACETKRAASMRAWWRAKWMVSGEFDRRYVTPQKGTSNVTA